MTWTDPRTWSPGYIPTADDFNEQLRDNLSYLLNPASAEYTANEASNYTSTSTVFVDVDATDFSLTITPEGSAVMVGFSGSIALAASSSGSTMGYLDVTKDGVRLGGDDGWVQFGGGDGGGTINIYALQTISFVRLVAVTPGVAVTFRLQWKCRATVGTPTIQMQAGAGTANADSHPQFWVKE